MSQQAEEDIEHDGTVHFSTNELQSQSHVGCRATHSLDRCVDFQPVLSACDYCCLLVNHRMKRYIVNNLWPLLLHILLHTFFLKCSLVSFSCALFKHKFCTNTLAWCISVVRPLWHHKSPTQLSHYRVFVVVCCTWVGSVVPFNKTRDKQHFFPPPSWKLSSFKRNKMG